MTQQQPAVKESPLLHLTRQIFGRMTAPPQTSNEGSNHGEHAHTDAKISAVALLYA
jgi:hypothetical protein